MIDTKVELWHVRWMIRRDMPEVMLTERLGGCLGWDKETFLGWLRNKNVIGMVAERQSETFPIGGYMVYELFTARLQVRNFAVHLEWCGSGAGGAMIEKLKGKLSSHRRTRIVINVPERSLDMQVFLRDRGFRATKVLGGSEAYRMEYRLE